MAVSTSNLVSGAAKFQMVGTQLAHTFGGIQAKMSPKNRMRKVDQYGESAVDIVHQGDDVRMTVPFAEWTAAVMQKIYNPGADNTASGTGAFLGVGRSAGFIYTIATADIIPLLAADAAKKISFTRVTPIGDFSIAFDNEKDRIISVDYACLVDTTLQDGLLIGKIYLN
ncbi:MAG: hypothetical protein ACKV0T_02345 [Planctomycetales bacterium]